MITLLATAVSDPVIVDPAPVVDADVIGEILYQTQLTNTAILTLLALAVGFVVCLILYRFIEIFL